MHSVLRDLLEERVAGSSEEELLQQSPKILYSILAETLPKPRLVARCSEAEVKRVFSRMASAGLPVSARHTLFCLVNEITRNNEHMYRVWGRGEPTCQHNPDITGECAGENETLTHIFQTCGRVSQAWNWLLSTVLLSLMPPGSATEAELLNLRYETPRQAEHEVIWILGQYYNYVREEAVGKDRTVGAQEMRQVLKMKKEAYSLRKLRKLNFVIP